METFARSYLTVTSICFIFFNFVTLRLRRALDSPPSCTAYHQRLLTAEERGKGSFKVDFHFIYTFGPDHLCVIKTGWHCVTIE